VRDLGKMWDPMEHFFLGANLLLAQSDIRKSEMRYAANKTLDRHTPKNSPLFEQAPYSVRSEEHTSELQSRENLVCRLVLEKKSGCRSGIPLMCRACFWCRAPCCC